VARKCEKIDWEKRIITKKPHTHTHTRLHMTLTKGMKSVKKGNKKYHVKKIA
jgi:hypothetical protein